MGEFVQEVEHLIIIILQQNLKATALQTQPTLKVQPRGEFIIMIDSNMNKNKKELAQLKVTSLHNSRLHHLRKFTQEKQKMEKSLESIIQIGSRGKGISAFFKHQFFHLEPETSQDKLKKIELKSFLKKQTVSHLERAHFSYFVPTLEADDHSLISKTFTTIDNKKANSEINIQISQSKEHTVSCSLPLSPLRSTKYIFEKDKDRQQKKLKTQASKGTSDYFDIKKRSSVKQKTNSYKSFIRLSNTFLFSLPTRIGPKKRSLQKEESVFSWEDGLAEVINSIGGTKIKHTQNIKIERQKLSQFLKKNFFNEAITVYYKCQATLSFRMVKDIVTDMMLLPHKEANLLTFFTYDINGDGFICQEDLYFFLERLPFNAKVMQDLNFIIEFLRKNKVRSTEVNLPQSLLSRKSKTQAGTLWNEAVTLQSIKDVRHKQKLKLMHKFFSLMGKEQEEPPKAKHLPFYKKFQINFDVFNLIFAEKRPVLIAEIIKKLIEKPEEADLAPKEKEFKERAQTEAEEQFLYTRSQEWKSFMGRSQHLHSMAKAQKQTLSYELN